MQHRKAIAVAAIAFAALLTVPAQAQVSPPGCAREGVDDKCEAWVAVFDDDEVAEVATESPADVAVSPDGAFVYSAMRTTVGTGFDSKSRWAILAHDADGEQRWLTRWGSPEHHSFPTSIAVSPGGRLVFVSGTWRTDQVAADGHLTTIAFDSGTGDVVWKSNYDGPAGGTDNARDVVVSPDGRTLYVAGISAGTGNGDLDYAAIAYDAATGRELWVTRWDGVGRNNSDSPFAIGVSSRGDMLYLTGWSYGEGEFNNDYGTIAVDAAGDDAGTIVWSARYDGVGVRAPDQAAALTISPDDRTVFVTGMSDDVEGGPPFEVNYGYATVAYDALSGEQLWEARKHWPDSNFDAPTAVTIDPRGRRLLVTGQVGQRRLDFGTVAYDPATGQEVWSDRYGLPEYDFELGRQLVVDPRGDTAYVGGLSAKSPPGVPGVVLHAPNADAVTIAYDVETGEKRWLARFNPSGTDFVSVQSMAVSPDATKTYAVASIDDQNWDGDGDDVDAAVFAYDIGPGIPIQPPPPTLQLAESSELRGQYSDATTLAARLTSSSGDPIAGAELRFEFQGEVLPATTDEHGVAAVSDTLDQAPGDHALRVLYDGDEDHGPASLEATYTIEPEDASLLVEVDRKQRFLRATLRDADSQSGIAERRVVFYYKGEEIGSAVTDSSGIAELRDVPEGARAEPHVGAAFEGDAYYLSATAP
ncbi:MAG: PQQ-binding-like beta-propeller repeat protein [Actinomycetota bacterium]|nr:PQQ-binding-like beta-propeller repeat protein [Actinomycetota bacterium]